MEVINGVLNIELAPNTGGKASPQPYSKTTHVVLEKPEFVRVAKESREERGRKCWGVIHTDPEMTAEKLAKWEETIPGYDCGGGCRKFYDEWKAANPPTFDEKGHLTFCWGVRLHNAVNTKLEKPTITLKEAIKIWRPGALDSALLAEKPS